MGRTPSPVQLSDFSTLRPIQQRHSDPKPISSQTSELVLYFFEHVKGLLKFHSNSNDITGVLYSVSLLFRPSFFDLHSGFTFGQTLVDHHSTLVRFRRIMSLGNKPIDLTTKMFFSFKTIVQEPRGAVTNAICALASLHHSRARQAAGYDPPDPNPEHSFTKFLYDQAFFQLTNTNHLNGLYTSTEAIAALHLTSFSFLSDGWTNWVPTLQIAKDWLASTGIQSEENPRLFVTNMTNGSAYAAKATMVRFSHSHGLQ